jgi:Amt family ammonium transporter
MRPSAGVARKTASITRGDDRLSRLCARLRDREWRRYGYLLLAGKALGIAALFGAMFLFSNVLGTDVRAEDPALVGNDIVNPINTVWTLVAAFLVFGMQAGFTMLEAGFCRSRETVNVLMECVVDTCLCGLLFYAWGFAFMFGSGTPLIGTEYFFLQGIPATYGTTGVAFLAFWLFQFAFADTCSTITSGAMIGRTGFVGDLIYSLGVSGFIYPIIGHWAWGPDGFLATMGSEGHFLPGVGTSFHDFAGSTVVHTIGGWVALAGAIAPASATKPPIVCTTVEPAKSWKPMPSDARKLPSVPIVTRKPSGPQAQCPRIG